jgi:hypothetical protein
MAIVSYVFSAIRVAIPVFDYNVKPLVLKPAVYFPGKGDGTVPAARAAYAYD